MSTAPPSQFSLFSEPPACLFDLPAETSAVIAPEPIQEIETAAIAVDPEDREPCTFLYFPGKPVVVAGKRMAREALLRHRDHAWRTLVFDRRGGRDETFSLRSLAFYQRQLLAMGPTPKPGVKP